jgi:hypothetical protein
MKKFGLLVSIVALAMLAGCGVEELEFEGKTQKVERIADELGDRLEEENPDYDDIDVQILVTEEDEE